MNVLEINYNTISIGISIISMVISIMSIGLSLYKYNDHKKLEKLFNENEEKRIAYDKILDNSFLKIRKDFFNEIKDLENQANTRSEDISNVIISSCSNCLFSKDKFFNIIEQVNYELFNDLYDFKMPLNYGLPKDMLKVINNNKKEYEKLNEIFNELDLDKQKDLLRKTHEEFKKFIDFYDEDKRRKLDKLEIKITDILNKAYMNKSIDIKARASDLVHDLTLFKNIIKSYQNISIDKMISKPNENIPSFYTIYDWGDNKYNKILLYIFFYEVIIYFFRGMPTSLYCKDTKFLDY